MINHWFVYFWLNWSLLKGGLDFMVEVGTHNKQFMKFQMCVLMKHLFKGAYKRKHH